MQGSDCAAADGRCPSMTCGAATQSRGGRQDHAQHSQQRGGTCAARRDVSTAGRGASRGTRVTGTPRRAVVWGAGGLRDAGARVEVVGPPAPRVPELPRPRHPPHSIVTGPARAGPRNATGAGCGRQAPSRDACPTCTSRSTHTGQTARVRPGGPGRAGSCGPHLLPSARQRRGGTCTRGAASVGRAGRAVTQIRPGPPVAVSRSPVRHTLV